MTRSENRTMSRTAAAQMMFCASSCAREGAAMMMNTALILDASLLASILFVLVLLLGRSVCILLAILGLLVRIILVRSQSGAVLTAETKRPALVH